VSIVVESQEAEAAESAAREQQPQGHPLAPFGGPIAVRNARQGDVVAIDPIELTPFGVGKSAILRSFGRAAPRVPGAGSALLAGCATAEPGSAVLEEGFSAGFQLPPQAASASNH